MKEPSAFIYIVLYDEATETTSGILGVFNTYSKAVTAIMNIHPKSVCIDETKFINIPQTEHLFEYNTHLYSIHQKIIYGYLPSL